MRTTVMLDDDVARAVDQLRRDDGMSTSAAINALARRGLAHPAERRTTFSQQVSAMGLPRIPLDDIGGALDVLEGEFRRG